MVFTRVSVAACGLVAFVLTGCQQQHPPAATPSAVGSRSPSTATSTAAAGHPQTVPTSGYVDAERGLSFRYPTVWTRSHSQQGYLPSAILDTPGVHGKQTVTFEPLGVYASTNLTNLNFTYALLRNATAQTCHDAVAKNQDGTGPVTTAMVNGVAFTEISGGDAGMSHRLGITLDSTFRNGTCYLFERDEATIAPGVEPGKRTLTDMEEHALQRHLREVFESVRFQ